MKYHIGQKIKIKKDLDKIENFKCGYESEMKKFEGTIQIIDGVHDDYFTIENSCFNWDYRAIDDTPFKKEDIEFGDIITTRNEEKYVYVQGFLYGEDGSYYADCDDFEDVYDDDLKYCDEEENDCDIMMIQRNGQVVYERNNEVREMTLQDIIKELGYEIKIVKEKK